MSSIGKKQSAEGGGIINPSTIAAFARQGPVDQTRIKASAESGSRKYAHTRPDESRKPVVPEVLPQTAI